MSWKTSRPACNRRRSRKLSLQFLEERALLYAISPLPWPTTDLSYSIVPDGTSWNTYAGIQSESVWHQTLNGLTDQDAWQKNVATAFQTWANHSKLNFQRVDDDGSAFGHASSTQGNIRIGSIEAGTASGWAYFPSGGLGGDITVRSSSGGFSETYWSETRFTSLLTHEIGHSIGLEHSDVLGTVMGGNRTPAVGLEPDDIAGVQALYGAREQDTFDKASANDSASTASQLQFDGTAIDFQADLTSHGDVDHYRFTFPAGGQSLTISVDARQLSLLAPKIQVLDSQGRLVAEASGDYGTVASVQIDGLKVGESYTVVVDGATDDVFGMGAYELAIEAVVSDIATEPLADPAEKAESISEPVDRPSLAVEPIESETAPIPPIEPESADPTPTPVVPAVIPPVLIESPPAEEVLLQVELIAPTPILDTVNADAEPEIQPPVEIPLHQQHEHLPTVVEPSPVVEDPVVEDPVVEDPVVEATVAEDPVASSIERQQEPKQPSPPPTADESDLPNVAPPISVVPQTTENTAPPTAQRPQPNNAPDPDTAPSPVVNTPAPFIGPIRVVEIIHPTAPEPKASISASTSIPIPIARPQIPVPVQIAISSAKPVSRDLPDIRQQSTLISRARNPRRLRLRILASSFMKTAAERTNDIVLSSGTSREMAGDSALVTDALVTDELLDLIAR